MSSKTSFTNKLLFDKNDNAISITFVKWDEGYFVQNNLTDANAAVQDEAQVALIVNDITQKTISLLTELLAKAKTKDPVTLQLQLIDVPVVPQLAFQSFGQTPSLMSVFSSFFRSSKYPKNEAGFHEYVNNSINKMPDDKDVIDLYSGPIWNGAPGRMPGIIALGHNEVGDKPETGYAGGRIIRNDQSTGQGDSEVRETRTGRDRTKLE